MTEVNITIDGKPVSAKEGDRVLYAALDAGIYIPHLCAIHEALSPLAACRLCFVEIKGYPSPVTSCTEKVREGMKISTRSERVDRLVRASFDLIMSNHLLDCKDCPGNRNCGLQDVARMMRFPLKQKTHRELKRNLPVDESRDDFGYNPNHCILCGRCVWVCNEKTKCGILDFSRRGLDMIVSTFDGRPLAEHDACNDCLKCVEVCPVGALYLKEAKTDV